MLLQLLADASSAGLDALWLPMRSCEVNPRPSVQRGHSVAASLPSISTERHRSPHLLTVRTSVPSLKPGNLIGSCGCRVLVRSQCSRWR
jgi:hypothetical protein